MKKVTTCAILALIILLTATTTAFAGDEPVTETIPTITFPESTNTEAKEVLSAIQSSEKNLGRYQVTHDVMDLVRKYVTKVTPDNKFDDFGFYTSLAGDCLWTLTPAYALFLDTEDRSLYLVDKDLSISAILYGSCGNIDCSWGYGDNHMIIWGDFTILSNANGFSIWEYGKETKYIISNFSPKFDGWHSGSQYVFMHDGSDFRILDLEKEEVIEICKDYSGLDYDSFCNSFFYVNEQGHMATVNLLTLEKKEISKEIVRGFTGSDSIRGVSLSGESIALPGYVDWDGIFQSW